MIHLPVIFDKSIDRPGRYRRSKTSYKIANEESFPDFWEAFYHLLETQGDFNYPLPEVEDKINPYFGYFGLRFHPISYKPAYFNIGIDINSEPKTPIFPIKNGVLEYSGFGLINGNYIAISHPDMVTEDGYKLFSLYMHCKQNLISFTSYQKMLRQISLNSYPEIIIPKDKIIAEVGDSGNQEGLCSILHLQTIFIHKKLPAIAIDPAKLLGIKVKKNKTANVKTHQEFIELYRKHKKNINDWKIEKYWTSKIMNL